MLEDKNHPALFWIHLTLVIVSYASPFLLHWKLIMLGIFLLLLEYYTFGNCVLTSAEFGKKKDITFQGYLLEKMGFRFNRRKSKLFIRYELPIIIFLAAIIWQILLGKSPLLL